jgi:hypothetical protein
MGTRQIDAALSETGETRFSRRDALILTFIACLALAVRVLPSSLLHYESSPDEIFQYYEQAHRLVFGSGIVPWEYHEGTRSWFLPIVLASVMYFCSLFSDSPQIYFIACRAILGMLSLSVVYVAYQYLPPRLSEVGRFPVTLLCALFPYLAFFGAVALTETVATHLIFIAFILFRHRWVRRAPLQFMTIGVLLGLAFWLRIQLTPLLLVIGVYFCGVNVVRWCRLGSGFAVSILLVGVILDAITWGAPFHSLWANIRANVIMDVSSSFETTPFLGYLSKVRDHWPAATPLALLFFIGAVRQPIFALCGAVVLLSYSLVPHKELRFMYPALCFLAISSGYGIAEIACWAAQAGWARLQGCFCRDGSCRGECLGRGRSLNSGANRRVGAPFRQCPGVSRNPGRSSSVRRRSPGDQLVGYRRLRHPPPGRSDLLRQRAPRRTLPVRPAEIDYRSAKRAGARRGRTLQCSDRQYERRRSCIPETAMLPKWWRVRPRRDLHLRSSVRLYALIPQWF